MRTPRCLVIGLLLSLYCCHLLASGHREARALVFPNGGLYKLVIGLSIPIRIPNKTLGFAVNFQFQYQQLQNVSEVSQYFPTVVRGRELHHVMSRGATYRAMQTAMERRGLPGRSCILRAVCEAAETPLHHDGLLGELMHVMLTPGYGALETGLEEYLGAQRAGEAGKGCRDAFAACPAGLGMLDVISRLEEDVEDSLGLT